MRFSQRIGKSSVRDEFQIESIDKKLENRLWNLIIDGFFNKIKNNTKDEVTMKGDVFMYIWTEFFCERSDEIQRYRNGTIYYPGVIEHIKNWYFYRSKWYEKYDLIECLVHIDEAGLEIDFSNKCNRALEIEMAGYRLLKGKVTQITSYEEISEIEEALNYSVEWKSVYTHLSTSIEYFSNRDNPHYRNSIKEAISAVEALCIIITNDKKATLGKALKKIETDFKIHNSLKNAFSSLYGYTSDSGGIRHSLLEDDIQVSFEDAKFMLISCSAFINFLKLRIERFSSE